MPITAPALKMPAIAVQLLNKQVHKMSRNGPINFFMQIIRIQVLLGKYSIELHL